MSAVFAQSFAKQAPRDAVSVSPASFAIERERAEREMNAYDMSEELDGGIDGLYAAWKTKDAALIGRMVLEMINARLDRLAAIETGAGGKTYMPDEMARIVLEQHNLEVLTNRRGA